MVLQSHIFSQYCWKIYGRHTSRLSWHLYYYCEQVFIIVSMNDQYSICFIGDILQFLFFSLKFSELPAKWIFKMYSILIPIFYNEEFKSRFIYSSVILMLEKIASKYMSCLCIRKHFFSLYQEGFNSLLHLNIFLKDIFWKINDFLKVLRFS